MSSIFKKMFKTKIEWYLVYTSEYLLLFKLLVPLIQQNCDKQTNKQTAKDQLRQENINTH